MKNMGDGRRVARVEREIQVTIAQFLIRGFKLPLPGLVTVASVKMPADLRAAKVYISVLGSEEQTEEVVELPTTILEGKKLYENSCANCHKLFPANKHDKSGWTKTLERMAPKAKITEEQKNLVYNYLTYNM